MRRAPLLAFLLTLVAVGCRPADEIRTYEVPRLAEQTPAGSEPPATSPVSTPLASNAAAEPTHQMLGAMIASGEGVWFFKLVAPLAEIAPVEETIKNFFKDNVLFEQDAPKWTLPEGWTESAGSGMRFATLQIPADGKPPLEMSVIRLPKAGPWNAQVLSNVNRWRGQLGLPPTGEPALKLSTSPLPQSDEALLVDLEGVYSGGMSPPFAGGGASGASRAMPSPATNKSQASQPEQQARPAVASELKYELPKGWVDKGASGMRKANLLTGDGDSAAEITVFQFSAAAPAMADPLANVNRWRQQIELDIIDQAELDQLAEEITINGQTATYVEMIPEAKALNQAAIAAMQQIEGQVWFYKLSGTRDEVKSQREAFKAWLATIRL